MGLGPDQGHGSGKLAEKVGNVNQDFVKNGGAAPLVLVPMPEY